MNIASASFRGTLNALGARIDAHEFRPPFSLSDLATGITYDVDEGLARDLIGGGAV